MSEQPQKTIRVRIAVAVNQRAEWSAAGWHGGDVRKSNSDLAGLALECLDSAPSDREAVYFVEAELPVPSPITAAGVVAGQVERKESC